MSFIRRYSRAPKNQRKSLVAEEKKKFETNKNPEATIWTKIREAVNVKSLATDFVCIYIENFVRTIVHRAAEYYGKKHGNKTSDKHFPKDDLAMDLDSVDPIPMDISDGESSDEEVPNIELERKLTFTENGRIISIEVTKDDVNRAKIFKILADLGEDFTIEELIKITEIEFGIYQTSKKSFNDFIKMVSE
jgi:hypothetical protein